MASSSPHHEPESESDEENVKVCLKDAEELKQQGNDLFRAQTWNEALAAYRSGLGRLPKRKENALATVDAIPGEEPVVSGLQEAEGSEDAPEPDVATEGKAPTQTEVEIECAKARAVLNSNIGACHVKLGEHKEAVSACTQALLDDPEYIRALQRRAASNDKINSWSSLSSAQEDYTKLLALLPPTSPHVAEYTKLLRSLKPRVDAAQKAETAEMLGKLKGLGNSILGNFGLSTDNFKFVPQAGGGYSMNFQQ